MIDYERIIDFFYPEAGRLRDILCEHSRCVAEYAAAIVDARPELHADRDFVFAAAMLHDIGIRECDADGICCFGKLPYICHGVTGARILRENYRRWFNDISDIEPYARVCERHTGVGLTREMIVERNLPLPVCDLVPETVEEEIVCYADKFFSKTRPTEQKPLKRVIASLSKFGKGNAEKFMAWHEKFEG